MKTKTIAITGANGFLGKHMIQAAIRKNWTVNAIVRRSEAADQVAALGATPYIISPLTIDTLSPAIHDCDAIFHFLGITSGTSKDFEIINVGYAKSIINSALQHDIERIITLSGLGVDQYDKKSWATNDYFLSKSKIEDLFQTRLQPFVIFRPSYIFGPGDELLPYIIQDLLKGTAQVAGEGTTPMQPIYVDDVTKIFLKAAEGMGNSNTIYDLVGPEVITMKQLIDQVASLMKLKFLKVPPYSIKSIPLNRAAGILDLSSEKIDVTQSDVLGDNFPIQRDFKITLSPLKFAINAVISEVIGSLT